MVDDNGQTCLIEINTNPCIEESNALLAKLIPRMLSKIKAIFLNILIDRSPLLDDTFRLTIDKTFIPNRKQRMCMSASFFTVLRFFSDQSNCGFSEFSIDGYTDSENLW